ncbi:MAG: cupin domain-containing protein [Gammaproteobacteria bacterium]|jgi:mannose-6-phosphate isomerase-like protein (cupin superfamily)|nr:cupin domain-containing protein [Gammaproteobacteria bacterium]
MRAEVRKKDSSQEYETAERCHITEIANDSGDELLSIARARVDVGVTTAWHRLHDTGERYIIVSGAGLVEVEGIEATAVGPGDVVRIPPGKAQRIANTGDRQLIFYAVCTPPFTEQAYINLETGE